MLLIIGLGNPGSRYAQTRHNVGFMVVDELARELGGGFAPAAKFQAEVAKLPGVILAKPQTSMNLSGTSVARLARFYRIPLANIIVIYDELNLPLGTIRYRASGSSGGHNGIKSIIQHLGDQAFPRLRIGIGRPQGPIPTANFVLGRFEADEKPTLKLALEAAKVYILTKLKHN